MNRPRVAPLLASLAVFIATAGCAAERAADQAAAPGTAPQPVAATAETPPAEGPAATVDCQGDPLAYARVVLTINRANGKIEVVPPVVTVWLKVGPERPNKVCWSAAGLSAGETLHIEPKANQPDLFPDRESTIKLPRPFASSGDPAAEGSWKYSLWVTAESNPGERLFLTDPEVIVEGGGGVTPGG